MARFALRGGVKTLQNKFTIYQHICACLLVGHAVLPTLCISPAVCFAYTSTAPRPAGDSDTSAQTFGLYSLPSFQICQTESKKAREDNRRLCWILGSTSISQHASTALLDLGPRASRRASSIVKFRGTLRGLKLLQRISPVPLVYRCPHQPRPAPRGQGHLCI